MKKKFQVSIIAHRGDKKLYQDNTLLSFQKAIEAQAAYVELDVHLTKDKEIVVIHDYSTKSTGGGVDYLIAQTDLKILKTVDMGQGERIPTLRQVFEICKGKIGVQVEIKVHGVAQKLLELIKEFNMEDDVLISSFQHGEIADFKRIAPNIPAATLEPTKSSALKATFSREIFVKNAQNLKADGIHPFTKFVNAKLCRKAHEAGLFINPWTVDDSKEWRRIIDAGVDGIITNDPKGLNDYLSINELISKK